MRKFAVAVLALGVFGCAKPWPRVEPVPMTPLVPAEGEWRVTDHLVVITDASGTMAREALLPEAQALAKSFVAGIPDGGVRAKDSGTYEASFIGFGGSERLATAHGPVQSGDEPAVQARELAAAAAALRPLGSPVMGGSTPISTVLGEAGATLQGKKGRAAVVLISDGRADEPADALDAGRQLVSGYGDELCIHTVHMGDSPEGRELLGQLAALSTDGCGSARTAESVRSEAALRDMERAVFFGKAPLPPVAAPGPCDQRIVLRGITFAFDSAEIAPESGPVLDVAVDHLKQCTGTSLNIEGHTCSIGTDEYNQGLSERRAASVRQYLVDHGVGAERLVSTGVGEAGPVASNDTRDGRAQNRRVELVPPQ